MMRHPGRIRPPPLKLRRAWPDEAPAKAGRGAEALLLASLLGAVAGCGPTLTAGFDNMVAARPPAMTTYSYRVTREMTLSLLRSYVRTLKRKALVSGESFNLDFHAIVRMRRMAHHPLLPASGILDATPEVPWWNGRRLRLRVR
jgi:hypothetical protein